MVEGRRRRGPPRRPDLRDQRPVIIRDAPSSSPICYEFLIGILTNHGGRRTTEEEH